MEANKPTTLGEALSQIPKLSDSQLEEQLKMYQDTVENLNNLISKIDDRAAMSHMEQQVRAYTMHWHTLYNERQTRPSFLEKDTLIDLSNILFYSSDHEETEDSTHGAIRAIPKTNRELPITNRLVKVENDINDDKSYTVTIFNLGSNNQPSNDNIEFGPLQTRLNAFDKSRILLKGYGEIGSNNWNYSLSIIINNAQIEKCILFHETLETKKSIRYLK